ncbi:hypothetical protein C8R43DRAFT_952784 [Mycena crocata]|nr:hypothetical protein C8R43DRAFT_952784 [Mycena crocata]
MCRKHKLIHVQVKQVNQAKFKLRLVRKLIWQVSRVTLEETKGTTQLQANDAGQGRKVSPERKNTSIPPRSLASDIPLDQLWLTDHQRNAINSLETTNELVDLLFLVNGEHEEESQYDAAAFMASHGQDLDSREDKGNRWSVRWSTSMDPVDNIPQNQFRIGVDFEAQRQTIARTEDESRDESQYEQTVEGTIVKHAWLHDRYNAPLPSVRIGYRRRTSLAANHGIALEGRVLVIVTNSVFTRLIMRRK